MKRRGFFWCSSGMWLCLVCALFTLEVNGESSQIPRDTSADFILEYKPSLNEHWCQYANVKLTVDASAIWDETGRPFAASGRQRTQGAKHLTFAITPLFKHRIIECLSGSASQPTALGEEQWIECLSKVASPCSSEPRIHANSTSGEVLADFRLRELNTEMMDEPLYTKVVRGGGMFNDLKETPQGTDMIEVFTLDLSVQGAALALSYSLKSLGKDRGILSAAPGGDATAAHTRWLDDAIAFGTVLEATSPEPAQCAIAGEDVDEWEPTKGTQTIESPPQSTTGILAILQKYWWAIVIATVLFTVVNSESPSTGGGETTASRQR